MIFQNFLKLKWYILFQFSLLPSYQLNKLLFTRDSHYNVLHAFHEMFHHAAMTNCIFKSFWRPCLKNSPNLARLLYLLVLLSICNRQFGGFMDEIIQISAYSMRRNLLSSCGILFTGLENSLHIRNIWKQMLATFPMEWVYTQHWVYTQMSRYILIPSGT